MNDERDVVGIPYGAVRRSGPWRFHGLMDDEGRYVCGDAHCAAVLQDTGTDDVRCPKCGSVYGEPVDAAVVRLSREVAALRAAPLAPPAPAETCGRLCPPGLSSAGEPCGKQSGHSDPHQARSSTWTDDARGAGGVLPHRRGDPTACGWVAVGCERMARHLVTTRTDPLLGVVIRMCDRCAAIHDPKLGASGAHAWDFVRRAPLHSAVPDLTERELRVLRWVGGWHCVAGHTAESIARALERPVINVRLELAALDERLLVRKIEFFGGPLWTATEAGRRESGLAAREAT